MRGGSTRPAPFSYALLRNGSRRRLQRRRALDEPPYMRRSVRRLFKDLLHLAVAQIAGAEIKRLGKAKEIGEDHGWLHARERCIHLEQLAFEACEDALRLLTSKPLAGQHG